MKALYSFCLLATIWSSIQAHFNPAPLNKDGTVADTPEVAAAKHHHFIKVAKARSTHGLNVAQDYYAPYDVHNGQDLKYHGPPAPLNHDGTVAETPEVQHAKAAHFAAYSEILAHLPRGPHNYFRRKRSVSVDESGNGIDSELPEKPARKKSKRSPIIVDSVYYHGSAPLNHDGTVADTPEVKAAKAVHFAAHAKVKHGSGLNLGGYQPAQLYHRSAPVYNHFHPAPLNADGTVAETPEVQAAKSVHFAAHAAILRKYPVVPDYDGYSGYRPNYHVKRFIPAPLNHDGTVAETQEVHARRAEHMAQFHKALARLHL